MQIDQESYDRIAAIISSDASPVGIDAKKTHVLILHTLQTIEARLLQLELRLQQFETKRDSGEAKPESGIR